MYSGQPQPRPQRNAGSPSSLAAAPAVVDPRAVTTRYRPRPAPRLQGVSPFAPRVAAARERLGRVVQNAVDAYEEAYPQLMADAQAVSDQAQAVAVSQQAGQAVARAFAAAGDPITETTALTMLVNAHDREVADSVLRADAVMRNANTIPVLNPNGEVVSVDVSDDPAVLAAQQAARNSAWRPPTGVTPLVAPLVAPTPEQNAAAAVFGQAVPSPHAVLDAQAQAAPSRTAILVGVGILAYLFLRK